MEHSDLFLQQQLVRIEFLSRFLQAYVQANLEVFGAILQHADSDPVLQALIWNIFPVYLREEEHIHGAMQEQELHRLLEHPQPLAYTRKKPSPLPLTVADVAARVQVDFLLHRDDYEDHYAIQRALTILTQSHDPLITPVSAPTIEALFSHWGLPVPPSLKQAFLQTAVLLQEQEHPHG
jgi:hypothetical protein